MRNWWCTRGLSVLRRLDVSPLRRSCERTVVQHADGNLTGEPIKVVRHRTVRMSVWCYPLFGPLPPALTERLTDGLGIPGDALNTHMVDYPVHANRAWQHVRFVMGRDRVAQGMAYCPECLAGDARPFVRSFWLFPFCTMCPWHGVRLRDQCARCGRGALRLRWWGQSWRMWCGVCRGGGAGASGARSVR